MPLQCDMRFKKVGKKFDKRQVRTQVDRVNNPPARTLPSAPLEKMINSCFYHFDYPKRTLVGGVSVNSLCLKAALSVSVSVSVDTQFSFSFFFISSNCHACGNYDKR